MRTINKPLLVLVGDEDEAFVSEEYPPVIRAYSKGECFVAEGETHNGIRHNEAAMKRVHNWAVKNQLR